MPDDHFNGPRTDDFWSPTDDSSITDDWPATPEPLTTSDSWASDLSATTSDPPTDVWSPPTATSDDDVPSDTSWGSDLWASTTETSTHSWAAEPDAPPLDTPDTPDTPDTEPWVSDVWASTEPSPWVSDLWASSDPATSPPTDSWSVDETINYSDLAPPAVDGAPTDVPAVDDAVATSPPSVSEPFWRSESWLLEPLSEDTQSVAVTGDVDEDIAASWPDDSGTDAQAVVGDSSTLAGSVTTDEPAAEDLDDPAPEPVSWGDLGEDSEGSWNTYQRELDAPAGTARPAARPASTVEPPTNASEFASQRSAGKPQPPTKGFPGFMHKISAGSIKLKPTKEEQITRVSITDIRRSIAGLRQITFTNPKGGSGKTTAALLTGMTLGQLRGGYVLAWDNNETQGTLGVRASRDDHANTVRDLIADLPAFSGPVAGRVGDLAKYIRSQGDEMFDILASDEQAEAGEMMTAAAFQAVREVVGRFYKIICVDTGNNVRAANWAASIDSTDQLVVTASVRWESAYSASRMLDYLEQSGRGDLVSNAVTVLTMPASMKGLNVGQVETHFGVRTREVLRVPFDAQLDNGDEIPFAKLNPATRLAWLQIGAAIMRGL